MMRILRKGDCYALKKARGKHIYLSIYSQRVIGLLTMIFCLLFSSYAQESREGGTTGSTGIGPMLVGQKVPEEFWTHEHLFFVDGDTVRKTLKEYRDKPLLLDFWATWCGACIANFRTLEEIKKGFSDEINVLLINSSSTKDDLQKIVESFGKTIPEHWNGAIPSLIDDDFLSRLFPHIGVPYYVWISKKGVISAFTRASFVQADEVNNYLKFWR